MFKNVASQSIALFAFDTTTGAPKTGDAANMLFYITKDWGTVTAIAANSGVPTEMDSTNAKGWYKIAVSQTETNADEVVLSGKSSTSNVSVVGREISTLPPNFTLASIDSNGRVDVIKIAGTTQTARDIGASVLLSSGTGTGQLSITSGIAKVDVDTIKTNPVVNGGTITFPTTATLASTTNITAGTITTVTNLTNAATAGDLTATMKTSVTTAATSATPTAAAVTGNVGGNVTGSVGSIATGGITNASLAADTGLKPIRSSTAQAGAATTITLDAGASAVDSFYNNDIVYITGGTGIGQARFVSAYVGATKVATVAAWVTNPDNTSTFAILPFDAVAGASAPTAAQVATAVWQDATAGDFTVASSIGKALYIANVVPGAAGGHFIAGTNAATAITTALTANIVGNITGNLSGSVGSVTGAVGSVTGAVGSVTGNVGGNVTGSVGSVVGLTASDVGAIKAKTDSLTFAVAGQVSSNVTYVNDVEVTGDGEPGTEWGPA